MSTPDPRDHAYFHQHPAIILPAKAASLIGRFIGVPLMALGILTWQREWALIGVLLWLIRLWIITLGALILYPGWRQLPHNQHPQEDPGAQ